MLVWNEAVQDLRFILKMTSLDLVITYSALLLFNIFIDGYGNNEDGSFFESIGVTTVFLLLTFAFPFIETLLLQLIPILLLKKTGLHKWIIIIIDALLFSSLHIPQYDLYVEIVYSFPGGIILAWSFIKYYKVSWFRAFYVTMTIHALSNFINCALILFDESTSYL